MVRQANRTSRRRSDGDDGTGDLRPGAGATHLAQNYKMRDGSVEQTFISGYQAVRAIGEFEQGASTSPSF